MLEETSPSPKGPGNAIRSKAMAARGEHGWWPYWAPLFSFLILGEIAGRTPEAWQPLFLPIKVLVPGGLFAWFYARGAYSELRGWRPSGRDLLLDTGVGILGGAIWMAPYLVALRFDPPLWTALPEFLQPSPEDGFDAMQLGPGLAGAVLGIRLLGYAAVTPFVEELFVRSWLARFAEVFDRRVDFRDIPIGHFSWRSFWVVVVFFTASHAPWEWPVSVLWIVGTQLWFYHRRQLGALVVVHAASNLSIFLFVWLMDGRWLGPDGLPRSIWFFL